MLTYLRAKIAMKNKKMLTAYQNAEKNAVAESDNSHAMIAVLYDELIRSLTTYRNNINKANADLALRGQSFSKAVSIIYALQSSLNFEDGGEISENLFRLYEYARVHLLDSFSSQDPQGINGAIESLSDIRQAWNEIPKKMTVSAT